MPLSRKPKADGPAARPSSTPASSSCSSVDGEPPRTNDGDGVTFPPSLSKKLLQTFRPGHCPPPKRISNEVAASLSEVLRRFVVEAHNRASIEAECDLEGDGGGIVDDDDDDINDDDDDNNDDADSSFDDKAGGKKKNVPIHARHITNIAAELLMDYS